MKCDLKGKYALVTGGRAKIGYYIALSLLQNGATVYVTTRFPKNAIERYQKEKDYNEWKNRLFLTSVDFKVTKSVYEFCEFLTKEIPHLDILINNAA